MRLEHVNNMSRTSFDTNRSELIDFLEPEFQEKLQQEENECMGRITSLEEQQDSLVQDLMSGS